MSQKKRNPGAIRDLEFWINNGNPSFESLTVTGNVVVNGALTVSGGITTNTLTVTGDTTMRGNLTVSGGITVEDSITLAGTQIRHPVQFGPYTLTASSVSLVTDIPSWPNHIEMTAINISLNGVSIPLLQLSTLTGLVTAGYIGSITRAVDAAAILGEAFVNGFKIAPTTASNGLIHGHMTLRRHGTATSNTWSYTIISSRSDIMSTMHGSGHIVLPGPLVKLSVNTATGAQVYDNGEIAGFYRY